MTRTEKRRNGVNLETRAGKEEGVELRDKDRKKEEGGS